MAPQKHIIINAALMSMRDNLITGAYLKTIAASFWPGSSVGFRRIPRLYWRRPRDAPPSKAINTPSAAN